MSVSGSYNMIFLAAGVAQHKGFFKDEGLGRRHRRHERRRASIAALSNGDIDYTLLTGSVIRAAIRGLPVPHCRRLDDAAPPHGITRRALEIKTIKELTGKRSRARRLRRRHPRPRARLILAQATASTQR